MDCSRCDKSFTKKRLLIKHIKEEHSADSVVKKELEETIEHESLLKLGDDQNFTRIRRRSTRSDVNYKEEAVDDNDKDDVLISVKKVKKVQTNKDKPTTKKRRRTKESQRLTENNDDSEDEEINDYFDRKSSLGSIVIEGEAVTGDPDELLEAVDEDYYSHLIVDEDDILERVEITPMTCDDKDADEDFIPHTRTRISLVNINSVKPQSRKIKSLKNRNDASNKENFKSSSEMKSQRQSEKKINFVRRFRKCKEKFSHHKELVKHQEEKHFYKCSQCVGTIIFESKSAFQAHQKNHEKSSESKLINEEVGDVKKESENCDICEEEFSWPSPGHSCYLTRTRK